MKQCSACRGPIQLMTPTSHTFSNKEKTEFETFEFCSNLCRKVFIGEISEEDYERMKSATQQKGTTQN